MRKLIFAALALVVSACITPAPVMAATTPVISVGDISGVEGGTICVPLTKDAPSRSYSRVRVETHSLTALPGKDYVYTSVIVTLGSSQVKACASVPTIQNVAVDGSRAFTVAISPVRFAVIGRARATVTITDDDVAAPPAPPPVPPPAPTQTCPDGSVIPPTSVCPVPPPPPAPAPTGWLPSPSLSGVPSIPSNFDISLGLQPAWGSGAIPASSAPDDVGAFRFICTPGQVLADDPMVFPGQPGASHLHQFYGNTDANAFSTYESLRAKGGSTCNRILNPDGTMTLALNRSSYWMPAMLDGNGQPKKPFAVAIYYKRRPATDPIVSDPTNAKYEGKAMPLPNGLRFIYGFDMLTGKAPTGSGYFACDGPNGSSIHYANLEQVAAVCPIGNKIGAVLEAPECWDAKNLDSPNHRDHVAYPGYGTWGYLRCPDGYPAVIATFKLGAWYYVDSDPTKWSLSSDAMFPALPKGSTLHADWWGAWDPTVLSMWTNDGCINKMLNCSGGDLGNGQQLRGAQK